MAINDSGTRNQYTATAGQTVFPYTFEIFDKDDIKVQQKVYLTGVTTTLTEGTHYTVSGVDNDAGGDVTLITGAAVSDTITLSRDMALERLTDYQNSGDFLAAEVNSEEDRQWAAIQQIDSKASIGIRPTIDDPILNSTNTELAGVATRGGKGLGFNPDGSITYLSTAAPNGDYIQASTVGAMTALTGLTAGVDVVETGEFSTGNGGGGTYYVVLTSSVTPNGANIIQGVADPLISFVLQIDKKVDLSQLGAIRDGVTDDTAIIRIWAGLTTNLTHKSGISLFDNSSSALTEFASNTTIEISEGAAIKFTSGTNECILLSSKSNINFIGGKIEGDGDHLTLGSAGIRTINCTDCRVERMEITQISGIAVKMFQSSRCKVFKNRLHNNSTYGVEDKEGTDNKVNFNDCNDNGTTNSGSNAFGRGITSWMTNSCQYIGNTCKNNSEYQLRAYSEVGDALATKNCIYSKNHLEGGGQTGLGIQLYTFGPGDVRENIFSDNTIVMDGVDSVIGVSVQGDRNIYSNNTIINSNNNQTGTAYQLFDCTQCDIHDGIVKGVATTISLSGSSPPDECSVRGLRCYEVDSLLPSITMPVGGKYFTLEGCYATQGGVGTTAGILVPGSLNGTSYITGNYLDGFTRGLDIATSANAVIRDNTTVNSGTQGMEVRGASSNLELSNNNFDSAFPQVAGTLISIDVGFGRKIGYSNQAPSSDSRLLTWNRGDKILNNTPSVGVTQGWVCTVAGTAGTWVALPNL